MIGFSLAVMSLLLAMASWRIWRDDGWLGAIIPFAAAFMLMTAAIDEGIL